MDNCYGKGDRIPREQLHKGDRLTNQHIQTLSFLQEIVDENKQLKQRLEELEKEREKCQELHALAEESQNRIKDIEENCLKRADEVNRLMADEHRAEMMQVLDEKMETERSLKEEILKLRHEVESLQMSNSVLQEDTEWVHERQNIQSRIIELELLTEGLQIEAKEKTAERNTLQTSLNQSQVQTSELHQLQNLRALNQSLANELKETDQKNLEYAYRIGKLEIELKDDSTEEEHAKLMEALENKMGKLLKEKGVATMKEADMKRQCEKLVLLRDDTQKQIDVLEKECAKLVKDFQHLYLECGRLNRRLQHSEDSTAYKEFLAVKKELDVMKEENEILRLKVRTSSGSLPQTKDNRCPSAGIKTKEKKKLLSVDSSPVAGPPTP